MIIKMMIYIMKRNIRVKVVDGDGNEGWKRDGRRKVGRGGREEEEGKQKSVTLNWYSELNQVSSS